MPPVRDDHRSLRIDPSIYLNDPFFHARRTADGVRTTGDPTRALGYKVAGPDGGGAFAEWRWDGSALTLRTDRLGMFPIFCHASNDAFIVSTSVFKILAEGVTPEIDWPALAVFLRTGSFIGTDTAFARIKGLPPNAMLTWRPGKLDVKGAYLFVPRREPSRAAAVDDYIDAFRQAIGRRMPDGPFAVPLSGGRDSRHILFALAEAGCRPEFAVTGRRFPPGRTADEEVAGAVADAVAAPHAIVGPPAREVASYVAANVKTNMTAPRRGWKFSIARKLSESVQTSYDGIGGDMLSGGSALTQSRIELIESGKLEAFCRSYFPNGRLFRRMIPKRQLALMSEEVAVQHMLPELEQHLSSPNPATSFWFWNRTRRFDSTNPFGMLSDVPIVHTPFFDLELFELLSSLPVTFNFGGWLHDEVIAKAYPQHSHIPFEPKKAPYKMDAQRMRQTTWELTKYLLAERPSHLLRPEYYASRLAFRAIAFGRTARGTGVSGLVYLTELESIIKKGLPASNLEQD